MPKPYCTILAGPNGSGKTSIYEKLRPVGEFVNADVIAASLPDDIVNGARRVRAGKIAISRLNELIDGRADFVFETTLSSKHSLGVMRRARAAGFTVGLVYVILDTPDRHVERVRFRTNLGGHPIPEIDIVRRYEASLSHLGAALKLAVEAVVIDNSSRMPSLMFQILDGSVASIDYDRGKSLHQRIARILTEAF
jgi:predicted ABC-type ATPase